MCSEKSQTKTLRVKSDEIDTKQYEKFASSCASRFEGQRPGADAAGYWRGNLIQ